MASRKLISKNKHSTDFLADLAPVGPVETQFTQLIVDYSRRIDRIRAIAMTIEFDPAFTKPKIFLENAPVLHRLSLYESRLHSNLAANLAQLRELQHIRKGHLSGQWDL